MLSNILHQIVFITCSVCIHHYEWEPEKNTRNDVKYRPVQLLLWIRRHWSLQMTQQSSEVLSHKVFWNAAWCLSSKDVFMSWSHFFSLQLFLNNYELFRYLWDENDLKSLYVMYYIQRYRDESTCESVSEEFSQPSPTFELCACKQRKKHFCFQRMDSQVIYFLSCYFQNKITTFFMLYFAIF